MRPSGHSSGGSSPLTRGKPMFAGWAKDGDGLIPAHAGKTSRVPIRRPGSWAHPRSRGENAKPDPHRLVEPGSSPLTRGKPGNAAFGPFFRGLIPAHAGKTRRRASRPRSGRAHPRSRGENLCPRAGRQDVRGSSPLTRGKPARGSPREVGAGLIPAHAGKTFQAELEMIQERAHPRSRGENKDGAGAALIRWGSSPLTRGKQPGRLPDGNVLGLIPAHAGKTGQGAHGAFFEGAHPRSRGENIQLMTCPKVEAGSSPLTRGKLQSGACRSLYPGLIPAHAGKTCPTRGGTAPRRAHPRSRGENVRPAARGVAYDGSSPLTRGKRSPVYPAGHTRGLIPAHAGKTR